MVLELLGFVSGAGVTVATPQTQTTTGWIIFIAALGMMFGMLAVDVAQLMNWCEATTPTFVGSLLGHLASVIAAFAGGKLIPEQRSGQFTRAGDVPAASGEQP